MALNIGELVGYIGLDASGAEKGLDGFAGMAKGAMGAVSGAIDSASKLWAGAAGAGAEKAGQAVKAGMDTDLTGEGEDAGDSFGDGLSTKVKVGAAAAATAAGAVFGATIGKALSMDAATDKVAASLDLTKPQAKAAGEAAAGAYANAWAESTDEASAAVEAVMSSIKGMKNASTEDLQKVTEQALILSSAMGVDVVKAASTAGNMVHNGIAKDGTEAFDLLTSAMSKVPVQLREDILDATDEYGQFFTSLGIDGPAAMGMLAEGAKKGMYGIDKAGDAVKEFTIRSTDMSQSSKDAYEAIGLNAHDMANAILAGGDTAHDATQKIVKGLLKIKDPADQSAAAIGLFGTPLEDLSAKDIPVFLKSLQDTEGGLGDVAGATDDMGKKLADNASSNLSSFKNQVQMGLVDLLGNKAVPAITATTGWLSNHLGPAFSTVGDAVQKVSGFFEEHKGVILGVAGLIAAVFIPHLIAMGIQSMIAGGKAVVGWLLTQGGAIAAAAVHSVAVLAMVGGWILMGVQSMLAAAKVAAAWLIAMGPIGLVIALVAGLAVLIVKNWDTIKKATGAAWGWVSDKVSDAWETVKDKVTGGISAVVGFVTAVPGKLGDALSDLGSTVAGIFRDAMQAGKDKVTDIGGNIIGWIEGVPGKITEKLFNLTETVRGLFRDAMDAGLTKVTGLGGDIVGWIESIPGKLLNKLQSFKDAGRDLLQGFVDGMKNAAGVIEGVAGNVWDAVKGLLNGAITKINAALEFKIELPGPDLHVNLPDIPQLATGGRATAATLAVIGEGREPESVLPDSVLRGLLDKAHAAGAALAQRGGGPLIGQVVQREGESADELAERLWFKTRKRG